MHLKQLLKHEFRRADDINADHDCDGKRQEDEQAQPPVWNFHYVDQ